MLETIIAMSDSELSETLRKKTNINMDKIRDLFPIVGVCIVSNMKEDLKNGNLSEISKVIGLERNDYYYELQSKLVSCLSCKLSFSEARAKTLVSIILPAIMEYIKNSTSNNKGDIDELALKNLLLGKEKQKFDLPNINNFMKI